MCVHRNRTRTAVGAQQQRTCLPHVRTKDWNRRLVLPHCANSVLTKGLALKMMEA
ncbi:hypothetical protein LEMLEM_LOCUS8700 [Lemmus lemmus]